MHRLIQKQQYGLMWFREKQQFVLQVCKLCQSYDSRSNIFWTTCATSWKLKIFYSTK
jgi:hypothetical protein